MGSRDGGAIGTGASRPGRAGNSRGLPASRVPSQRLFLDHLWGLPTLELNLLLRRTSYLHIL